MIIFVKQICTLLTKKWLLKIRFATFGRKLRPLAGTPEVFVLMVFFSLIIEVFYAANRTRIGTIFPEILMFQCQWDFFFATEEVHDCTLSFLIPFNIWLYTYWPIFPAAQRAGTFASVLYFCKCKRFQSESKVTYK